MKRARPIDERLIDKFCRALSSTGAGLSCVVPHRQVYWGGFEHDGLDRFDFSPGDKVRYRVAVAGTVRHPQVNADRETAVADLVAETKFDAELAEEPIDRPPVERYVKVWVEELVESVDQSLHPVSGIANAEPFEQLLVEPACITETRLERIDVDNDAGRVRIVEEVKFAAVLERNLQAFSLDVCDARDIDAVGANRY